MPKERSDRKSLFRRSEASPFSCSSSCSRKFSSNTPFENAEDIKEWEEARCPVCMEHPHNAVLLLCSSHDKGCRPYMCDTSYRHSNCLDQFLKACREAPSDPTIQESQDSLGTNNQERHSVLQLGIEELSPHPVQCEVEEKSKLSCPLCRGQITRWIVMHSARQFMNAKVRGCAQEACMFHGTYSELRKHARHEHPLARPSEVDPQRQREWSRMERQRDLDDVFSTFQSVLGEDREDESLLSLNEGSWLGIYFLIRVLPHGTGSGSRRSVPSRIRGLTRSRRRTILWGEEYDAELPSERESNDTEGVSAMWRPGVGRQRSASPDDEL